MRGTRRGVYDLVKLLRSIVRYARGIYIYGRCDRCRAKSLPCQLLLYTALRKPDLTITQDYFRRHILSGQAMVRTEKDHGIYLRKVEHYIRNSTYSCNTLAKQYCRIRKRSCSFDIIGCS